MEPALDKAKLLELLGQAHEHEALDYKGHLDLNDRRAELELVKDIAAFSASSGYLVVGADDAGSPTATMTRAAANLLDESRLRAKARRYLPEPLELRTTCHDIDGALVVLIYIGAHPDGFVIVQADGQVDDRMVFRRGDVFVRHGTASERWGPHDFPLIREALIRRRVDVPELLPAPPSTHRIDEPRLVHTGSGDLLHQRVLIEVDNVGPATAYVIESTAVGYDTGANGPIRPPAAIPPYFSRPFELNVHVPDANGLVSGAEIELRVRYEGGSCRRDLRMVIRHNGSGGFENASHDTSEL